MGRPRGARQARAAVWKSNFGNAIEHAVSTAPSRVQKVLEEVKERSGPIILVMASTTTTSERIACSRRPFQNEKAWSLQPKHKADRRPARAKRSREHRHILAAGEADVDGDPRLCYRAACEGAIAHDIVEQFVPMLPSDDEFAKATLVSEASRNIKNTSKPAESLFVAVVDLCRTASSR